MKNKYVSKKLRKFGILNLYVEIVEYFRHNL